MCLEWNWSFHFLAFYFSKMDQLFRNNHFRYLLGLHFISGLKFGIFPPQRIETKQSCNCLLTLVLITGVSKLHCFSVSGDFI